MCLPDVSASAGGEVELVNQQPDYTTTLSMTFNGETATGKATFVVGLCGGTTPFTATRS